MKDLYTEIILRLKSSPGYVTRDELGKACGVGSCDVLQAVETLRSRGYRIDEIPGEGYRLVAAPDLIDACEIKTALADSGLAREVHVFTSVTSTNDVGARLAKQGADHGTVVVAEEQTEGRGRLGRRWESPPGLGLWFSLVLRPDLDARASSAVSLVCALGVAVALRKRYGIKADVKWPNDVVVGPRKICGILTEADFTDGRASLMILGFGLNVLHVLNDFPPELRGKATSIRLETNRRVGRAKLLAEILGAVEEKYAIFSSEGFVNLRRELLALSPLIGKVTRVVTGGGEVEGTALGIDDTGALVLRTESGQLRSVIAGDIVRVG
ncbi:MAG: biotin--[acetyl-CoA-carboxylase] ligase [Candidatus Eisenbacteria bacterium]